MTSADEIRQFRVTWRDAGKWPRAQPNPAYPDGIDIDATEGAGPCCTAPLPYPAKRIGSYLVHCRLCGLCVACTTAGRPDDPRSITMTCKGMTRA